MRTMMIGWAVVTVACLTCGCGGDAQLELAASDAVLAVADQITLAVEEYDRDTSAGDDARTSAVVSAFVARVRRDVADEVALDGHASAFEAALGRILDDREVAWQRRQATLENVGTLREVAHGLRRLAIQSLTLNDELQRYLEGWLTTRQRATAAAE